MEPTRAAHELDVVIIGGGLAGLSCALSLRDSGLRVAMFERESALGGRAASVADAPSGISLDIGPHILLTEYRNMLDMLDLLGTRGDVMWQRDQFVTLLDGGDRFPMRLYPLPAPFHFFPSLAAVRRLSVQDKLSNARITWLALRASEQHRLQVDSVSARELLNRYGVSDHLQRWFWSTATLALLNVPLHECSGAALLRMYANLIGRSGYASGFATQPLAALFVHPARKLLERSGCTIETRQRVERIEASGTHIAAVHLEDGRRIGTRACVLAVPPDQASTLLARSRLLLDGWKWSLTHFEPCPYISTYLWLDRKVTTERFWSRIWSPHNLNADFYDLSNFRADVDPSRALIAANCIHSSFAANWSDDEIVAKTMSELSEFAPAAREARVLRSVIHRIPMAIACPKPGTEHSRPDALTQINGLFLAGDWTNTHLPSCMESAVYSGRIAAEYILNGQRASHSAAFPPPQPNALVRLLQRLAPPALA
jgi:15-cis-phytoene desaturase